VETRDPKTGDIIRYNADDDTTTLGDMLRQERFGGGSADQRDMDAEFARQIMTDGGFKVRSTACIGQSAQPLRLPFTEQPRLY
jgi:hypothetical protein